MDDTSSLVAQVLEELDISVAIPSAVGEDAGDLVLDPEGIHLPVEIKRWSLITEETVHRVRANGLRRHPPDLELPLILVADRITESAKRLIRQLGWGYLDLRGEFSLRSRRLILQASFKPRWERSQRSRALSGRVGIEVATHILMNPTKSHAIRELAREIGRSPSTVSDVVAALRQDSYVSDDNRLVDARLFWAVAEEWPTDRTYLHERPPPGSSSTARALGLELDNPEAAGWALTDSAAAAGYGAPIAVRSGQTFDFFVPTAAIQRRARNLLHPSVSPVDAGCSVRVAPVPAACAPRTSLHVDYGEWPATHRVFVALDLAQDEGRGREILENWTPEDEWSRVW